MTASVDPSIVINDHIGRVLLRYFRKAFGVETGRPRLDLSRDMEMLRLHWSMSPALRDLTTYILANRHETQSFLTFREHVEDGVIRGRLDARATIIRRMTTGHPTTTVTQEPVRSFASGANQVVAWVLEQAWRLSARFLSLLPEETGYRDAVEANVLSLERVRRIDAIRTAMNETNLAGRPQSGALQQAVRSRRRMYRLAYQAFMDLVAVEAGDLEVIGRMLQATLLGPLETWQRFELAVGLSLAEGLEQSIGEQAVLSLLRADSKEPIARIGRFAVFWQTRTHLYQEPTPEPSETIVKGILNAYGLSPGGDRPDLVVVDAEAGAVVAVVEVKFFGGDAEDNRARIREAAAQLVRYGRGYEPMPALDALLGRSIIAVIRNAVPLPVPRPFNVPFIVDFEGIKHGQLTGWADSLPSHS